MNQNNSKTDRLVLTIIIIGMVFVAGTLYQLGRTEAKINLSREMVLMSR